MTENEAIKAINDKYETLFALSTTSDFDMAMAESIKALEEIQQYRAIGTVEECRVAVEKMKPKKPNKDEFYRFTCPDCGWIVSTEEYGGRFLPHCENCGQSIDWSE